MPWPKTSPPFDVEALLEAGHALTLRAQRGEPADRTQAIEIVNTLDAYVSALPHAHRRLTAQSLVNALATRPKFEAGVAPRRRIETVTHL